MNTSKRCPHNEANEMVSWIKKLIGTNCLQAVHLKTSHEWTKLKMLKWMAPWDDILRGLLAYTIELAKIFVPFFLSDGLSSAQLSLTSFETILWQLSYQQGFFKNFTKTGEFSCTHFNNEDGKKQHFSVLYFIILRMVKMKLICPKRFVQCMEKVSWLVEHVKSGLPSFLWMICHWTMIHNWADHLKLMATKLRD